MAGVDQQPCDRDGQGIGPEPVGESGSADPRDDGGGFDFDTMADGSSCDSARNSMKAVRDRLVTEGAWEDREQEFVNWLVRFSMETFNSLTGPEQNAVGLMVRDELCGYVLQTPRPQDYLDQDVNLYEFCQVASFEQWYDDSDLEAVRNRKNAPKDPKVSIVIPTMNVEPYVDKALDSLLSQKMTDFEAIIVIDGSQDRSVVIAKRYELDDPRFVVINKNNEGYGCGMNDGMSVARGKYLAILEPDDFYLPNMLQSLYDAAEKYDAQVVRADFYRFKGEGRPSERELFRVGERSNVEGEYYDRPICPRDEPQVFRFHMNTWCGIYRMDFLRENGIEHSTTPGASFQDNGLWFKSYAMADRVVLIREPGYMNRRDNPGSSVKNPRKALARANEYGLIYDYLVERPEVFAKLSSTFWLKYVHNVDAAISVVDPELHPAVIERGQQDLQGAMDRGEIDLGIFSEWEQAELNAILGGPDKFRIWQLEEENRKLKSELKTLKNTHSYKVGTALMTPLSAIKGKLRR